MPNETVDAVVAGGSFAGVAAAAALSQLGMSVAICEPGLADHRRLAGELIQAPGADALEALGLLAPAWEAGAVPSCGFAITPGRGEPPIILSYGESDGCHSTGIALEHAVLARALLAHVSALPKVTVLSTRVTSVCGLEGDAAQVQLASGDTLSTSIVVAADGRNSKLRERAGIGVTRGEPVRMMGVRVRGPLPHEGYGHVALGGRAPVLAYRIARDLVRVLFTAVDDDAQPFDEDLGALPEALEAQARAALREQQTSSTVVYGLTPQRSAHGRLFLAGDAGGCVHPITATGVSFCAQDALRLKRALVASQGDVLGASERYHAERVAPMRTRVTLGPLLAEALADARPEAQLMRRGLVRYWRSDRRGRAASLGLLSTHEPRFGVLAKEYVRVMGYALREVVADDASIAARVKRGTALLGHTGQLALKALQRADRRARELF